MTATPKPLTHSFHIKLEELGHRLVRTEDGDVDIFQCDSGFHNGPGCELCGKSWCHHCGECSGLRCSKAES